MTEEKKKKKENSIEQQKPNVEVEVYNNNKKCDWEKKAQKLNWTHNTIKINNYNRRGGKGKKKEKKNPKESIEQVKTQE